MCTGEVERKVWMRFLLAGLMASAQRSMSLKAARDSPQITAFLERVAISWTAAKSPSDAMGKPASMMSTPMSSSSSATAIFSSWVIVAPGHCSPSRKVVSKMTTRSLSDWVGVVMERFLLLGMRREGALGVRSAHPLSAQAQMPVRPSGAGKQKERPKNEGGTGGGAPGDRAAIAANRHCLKSLDGCQGREDR